MLYQALFTARNAGIFTAGLHGTTEGNILRSGGDVPVWSMNRRNVMHQSDMQDAVVKAVQEVFLHVLEKNIREVLESESGE